MTDTVRIGLCGLGTVGSGVVQLFQRGDGTLDARAGVRCELVHVGARRDHPEVDLSDYRVSRDVVEVARDPEVDVLVELIGGTDTAKVLVETALPTAMRCSRWLQPTASPCVSRRRWPGAFL